MYVFCFYRLSVYLKGTCISSKLSSFDKNSSKEKSTLPRLVFTKTFQSGLNRSYLNNSLSKFLKHRIKVILFVSLSSMLGVIRNCAWWSEMSVIRFSEIAVSLTLLKSMLSISVFDLCVIPFVYGSAGKNTIQKRHCGWLHVSSYFHLW